jgi:predicted HD phosphohydrolase
MADATREDYELLERLEAPHTAAPHGEMVAAILRPFVREELCWVIEHHGLFQTYYHAHHSGGDRYARERHRHHPYYAACVEFCGRSLELEDFEPLVRAVCAQPRYLDRG